MLGHAAGSVGGYCARLSGGTLLGIALVPLKSWSARGLMASVRFTGSPCLQPIPRPVNNLAFPLIHCDVCEPILRLLHPRQHSPLSLLIEGLEEGLWTFTSESTCTFVAPAAA